MESWGAAGTRQRSVTRQRAGSAIPVCRCPGCRLRPGWELLLTPKHGRHACPQLGTCCPRGATAGHHGLPHRACSDAPSPDRSMLRQGPWDQVPWATSWQFQEASPGSPLSSHETSEPATAPGSPAQHPLQRLVIKPFSQE